MRPAVREIKKSFCNSESLPVVQQQTHIRPISWSKPIRDSEGRTPPLIGDGPDIHVRVCTFENAAVRQRERCAQCCQLSDFSDQPNQLFPQNSN